MEQRMTKKRSLIKKYFNDDLLIDMYKITRLYDFSNNEKGVMMKELLTERGIPWSGLGPGTNRMGIQIDGYAVKIALDRDGMIDNQREMLYTKELQPYVIKVYECLHNGLLAVSEYVEPFTMDNIWQHKAEMTRILKDISSNYLIGDVGIVRKNYCNWGTRLTGEICILDYAYIYSTSFNTFRCSCSMESLLHYDDNYDKLICPVCGKKYEFREIRRRITRKMQDEEIGDINRLGYVISKEEESVPYIAEFEPSNETKKKKKLSSNELEIKRIKKRNKLQKLLDKGVLDLAEYYEELEKLEPKEEDVVKHDVVAAVSMDI